MPSEALSSFTRISPKPWMLLVFVSFMTLCVYMDRGVIGTNAVNGKRRDHENPKGDGLQGELNLSYVQDGLLSSLYMVGRLIGPPIFSQSVRYFDAFHIIGGGMVLWMVGVVGSALSPGFVAMVIARLLTGLGGTSVIIIAPSIIDDKAPREQASLWLSLLYMQGPAGIAVGYAVGAGMEAALGWKSAFMATALLMLPATILCFLLKPVSINRGHAHDAATSISGGRLSQLKIIWEDSKTILSHPVFDLAITGNAIHIGVLGTLFFWQLKSVEAIFHQNGTDIWLAAMLLFIAISGNLTGGCMLDRVGPTIPNALYMCFTGNFIAGLVLCPSYLFIQNFYLFMPLITVGFFFATMQLTLLGFVTLWSVPLHLRPLAASFLIVSMHLLGDIPSPALFGKHLEILEDDFDQSEEKAYRIAIAVAVLFFIVASGIYLMGAIIGRNAKDYRTHQPAQLDNNESIEGHDEDAPLLTNAH